MNNGPSDSTFARLAKQMPAMLKQVGENFMARKAAGRNGCGQFPCTICGEKFRSGKPRLIGVSTTRDVYCPDCNKNLDDGYTAVVTLDGSRFAFVRSEHLKDMAGKVVPVRGETMDAIAKDFEIRKKPHADTKTTEDPDASV